MASGHDNQVTKQVGEYLVAAEICRRGYLATTFTGNVPHFDILASSVNGKHQAIQVKAIKGAGWQFNCRAFFDIQLNGKKQTIGNLVAPPAHLDLICVLVQLRGQGRDIFYVLTWTDLQRIAFDHHNAYLKKHKGIRPKKHDSFHMAISAELLKEYQDRWEILDKRLR